MAVYKISNLGSKQYLTIVGSNLKGSSLYDGQGIKMANGPVSPSQMWIISSTSKETFVSSYLRRTFGLNLYKTTSSKYKCNLHKIEGNESDATVVLESAISGGYRIKQKDKDLYLTPDLAASGTEVFWTEYKDIDHQIWKLTEIEIIESVPGVGITSIVGNTITGHLTSTQMEKNAKYIYDYLTEKGFSKNAICAMLGNFQAESSLNPGIWQVLNSTNGGYGIAQWTKATYFLNWAVDIGLITSATSSEINSISTGYPKKLMNAELAFLMWTLELSGDYFTSTSYPFSKFKTSTDSVATLAKDWYNYYEQPNDGTDTIRVQYAENWEKFFS